MFALSTWTVTDEYRNTDAGEAFATLDKVFALANGTPFTDDIISDVKRFEVGDRRYFVKRFTGGGKNLRKYIGRSRVRSEWENLLFFKKLGLPGARVVAYGEEIRFGIFQRGAMITEEAVNTNDLWQMTRRSNPLLKDRAWMSRVISQVAHCTRIMHEHGFIHTDLKWRNILVTQEPDPKITLIDCPAGGKQIKPFAERGKIKDLACLDKLGKRYLSRTQRLKFYQLYTGRCLTARDKQRIRKILAFFEGRE